MRPIDADAFKKYIDAQEGRPFIGCTVGEAMKILIDEQPTVQPEPKEGEWVLKDHLWECNKCGCRINVKNPLCNNNWNYYFCPHCGTKMTIAVQRF